MTGGAPLALAQPPSRRPEVVLGSRGLPRPFKGLSGQHTASDPRPYLGWCAERDIEPLHRAGLQAAGL